MIRYDFISNIEIFGIAFTHTKHVCKFVIIDEVLSWIILDNVRGMKLFDLFVRSNGICDVSLHLKDCRFSSICMRDFNVVKLINDKNPVKLLQNISQLYFVDKFFNYSKVDSRYFVGNCEIIDVKYINFYPAFTGGLVVNGLNMRLPINHNYLYGLFSGKLGITKKEFDHFIDWCEDKIFTNLQQLRRLFVDYFEGFNPKFITFDVVDRSLSKIKRLDVMRDISLDGLHSVLLNVNILGNLKVIYCIVDCYINSSAVSDYILRDGLEYCEIGALTNISGLKVNLPQLRLRIYFPGISLDFIGIHRIRVLRLWVIFRGICNKLQLCKFPYERKLECSEPSILSKKLMKILDKIELCPDTNRSYWGFDGVSGEPNSCPSKNYGYLNFDKE